jgi:hypothetical protein
MPIAEMNITSKILIKVICFQSDDETDGGIKNHRRLNLMSDIDVGL